MNRTRLSLSLIGAASALALTGCSGGSTGQASSASPSPVVTTVVHVQTQAAQQPSPTSTTSEREEVRKAIHKIAPFGDYNATESDLVDDVYDTCQAVKQGQSASDIAYHLAVEHPGSTDTQTDTFIQALLGGMNVACPDQVQPFLASAGGGSNS